MRPPPSECDGKAPPRTTFGVVPAGLWTSCLRRRQHIAKGGYNVPSRCNVKSDALTLHKTMCLALPALVLDVNHSRKMALIDLPNWSGPPSLSCEKLRNLTHRKGLSQANRSPTPVPRSDYAT